MASKKRNFEKDMLVGVTVRIGLRRKLWGKLHDYAMQILARNSRRCRVRIIAYFLLDNHLHLILAQDINGHHDVVGISAFMRNVNSALMKKANRVNRVRYRIECTYRSFLIRSTERLIQALAYLHGQLAHHRIRRSLDRYTACSWSVYTTGTPDGVVDCLPEFYRRIGRTRSERSTRTRSLLRSIARQADSGEGWESWVVATGRALSSYRRSHTWLNGLVEIGRLLSGESHMSAREALIGRLPSPRYTSIDLGPTIV